MNQIKKYFPYIVLLVFFSLHLPFLTADPDPVADPYTRGAFTDEGLYSSQIRNLIGHGHFEMKENSTYVRGPVFNLIQLPFFLVLGTHLWVSRLVTIVLTVITIFIFLRNEKLKLFGVFLVMLSFCEYRIFQFSHYGLSEMVCIDFIMLGMYSLYRCIEKGKRKFINLLIASFFIFLCYSTKIQFLYIAVIIPAAVLIYSLKESLILRKFSFAHYRIFFWTLMLTLFFGAVYFLCWYLPNRELYNYIMSNETSERFPDTIGGIRTVADFNYRNILWIPSLKVELIHIYIVMAAVLVFSFIRKKRNGFFIISAFSLIWIVSELHKVPMRYLPYRYLLSMFFACGVFVSSAYAGFAEYFPEAKKWFIITASGYAIYFLSLNFDSYQRRTWELASINNYLEKNDVGVTKVIGAWAPSSCWENNAITFPVWDQYFNWKDPVNTYEPSVIIAESDEEDSNQAYKNQKIDLFQQSDSVRQFNVWKYKLNIFWMKKK